MLITNKIHTRIMALVFISVLNVSIWMPAAIIGIVATILTIVGLRLGCLLGSASKVGARAEIFGGLVLLAIGFNILHQHGVF